MSRPTFTLQDAWHAAGNISRWDGQAYTSRAREAFWIHKRWEGKLIPLSRSEMWANLDQRQGPACRDLQPQSDLIEIAVGGAWGPFALTSFARLSKKQMMLMRDPTAPLEVIRERLETDLWAMICLLPSYQAWFRRVR